MGPDYRAPECLQPAYEIPLKGPRSARAHLPGQETAISHCGLGARSTCGILPATAVSFVGWAAHGHSVNLDLDDRDIAVRWFTLVPKEQGPLAPYKERPCTPLEDIPPRRDAAFQILDGELTPGFGQSGKMHNYFSSLPVEDMSNQAGVRKDLPIEIVFETAAVLRHASLFETASESVLCREKVPGSTILYIHDSIKDKILYSRPIETPASDAAAQMDDTSPTQGGRHPKRFSKHRSGSHP